jgi:hypothetical protein
VAPEDRDELEEAIEEGFRDFENGDHIGAREFLAACSGQLSAISHY